MITVRCLIDMCGGVQALSDALKLTPRAVYNWPHRGVPEKYRHELARLADVEPSMVAHAVTDGDVDISAQFKGTAQGLCQDYADGKIINLIDAIAHEINNAYQIGKAEK